MLSVLRTLRWLFVGVPLVLVIAVVVLPACVSVTAPARTTGAYKVHATKTAEAVVSALKTASLTVEMAERDRAFPPYVSVSLGEAESDAGGVQSSFESIQPPGARSDDLRAQLVPLLDEATGALADARIAARRNDTDALAATAEPLDRAARELEAFLEEHG